MRHPDETISASAITEMDQSNIAYSNSKAFSKKVESHAHAVALHYMHYNFCRIHEKLRETPAIAAGLADRLWGINDILRVLEDWETTAAG
jgi:hypothetical protein